MIVQRVKEIEKCKIFINKIKNRRVEVQLTLFQTKIPFSLQTLNQLLNFLENPITTINAQSTITIARVLHNNSSEYLFKIENKPYQTIKYSDVCELLNRLSIHINTKGKFILQQSSLLNLFRQKDTVLLEMIEDCNGNTQILEEIEAYEKKQKDLEGQKTELLHRKEEIEDYRIENEKERELDVKRKEMEKKEKERSEKLRKIEEKKEEVEKEWLRIEYEEKRKQEEEIQEELKKCEEWIEEEEEERKKESDEEEELKKILNQRRREWEVR